MSREVSCKEIGFRIRTLRMEHNVMQTDLAKELDMSQTHMSNIERGKAGLTIENLVKLADKFDCSLDELVFGESKYANEENNNDELLNTCTLGDLLRALQTLKK